MFITLEDETGITDLVAWTKVARRLRINASPRNRSHLCSIDLCLDANASGKSARAIRPVKLCGSSCAALSATASLLWTLFVSRMSFLSTSPANRRMSRHAKSG
ncbi:hypothetical protein [Rhizobium sp. SL86]|uniref:hypothetical protein n=1 Tax=Rhizobium sp. SL86 TaxID=2995148 RepID=UPI002276F6A6|nr:hypothetical protein [Rhizobium sp. SL86]MCY1667358.1 hypothetical protein [Rhizobium sp. SL86]